MADPKDVRAELQRIGARAAELFAESFDANGFPVRMLPEDHEALGRLVVHAMSDSGWTCLRNDVCIAPKKDRSDG